MGDIFPLLTSARRGGGHPRRGPLRAWAFPFYPRPLYPPRHGPWAGYGVGRGCLNIWDPTDTISTMKPIDIYNIFLQNL